MPASIMPKPLYFMSPLSRKQTACPSMFPPSNVNAIQLQHGLYYGKNEKKIDSVWR